MNLFTSEQKVARSRPKGVLSVMLWFAGMIKGESIQSIKRDNEATKEKKRSEGNQKRDKRRSWSHMKLHISFDKQHVAPLGLLRQSMLGYRSSVARTMQMRVKRSKESQFLIFSTH